MQSLSEFSSPTLTQTLSVVDTVLGQLARRLPAHVSREDLASAGKVALVEILLRPEPAPAGLFHARVRGAMLDELRRLDPLSRRARSQVSHVRRITAELESELGRAPDGTEVAEAAGLTLESLSQVEQLDAAAQTCSVDERDAFGEPRHVLVDPDAPCPARLAEADDVTSCIQAALDRLPSNHAHVLRRYFLDEATLDDIAGELGVSKERVRQIREAAARKLRSDFMVLALWQSFLNREHDSA